MKIKIHILATIITGVWAQSSTAEVFYLQNFGNASGSPVPLADAGWSALVSTKEHPEVSPAPPGWGTILPQAGNPRDLANVKAAPSSSEEQGLASLRNAEGALYKALVYTEQAALDPAKDVPVSFQWIAAGEEGGTIRPAIRIGDAWYVGNEKKVAPMADDAGEFSKSTTKGAAKVQCDLDGGKWFPLKARPGEAFVIQSKQVDKLPDGPISAWGFFVIPAKKETGFLYFDTFLVRTLPVTADEAAAAKTWYNVMELGAKGDGVADDAPAFQRGLDLLSVKGGTLHVPSGNYRIAETLRAFNYGRGSETSIRIQGVGAASRLLGDGVDYILAGRLEPAGAASRYSQGHNEPKFWNGLRVDGMFFTSHNPKHGQRCGGIDASYMLRWECSNSYFEKLVTGIFQSGASSYPENCTWIIRIRNNVFDSCSDFAIKFAHIFDMAIEGNVIENCDGGIAVGRPGDGLNAAAYTLRIFNNIMEGIGYGSKKQPAILGSCWVGFTIQGNYFEANAGGDIRITPEGDDGGLRGGAIIGNAFSPTKTQLEEGYGPLYLRKAGATAILGNFTTSANLLHPQSQLQGGVNIAANSVGNPPAMLEQEGAKGETAAIFKENEEIWEVAGRKSCLKMNPEKGFQYQSKGEAARSIRYGSEPPGASSVKHEPGDMVFNQEPSVEKGGRVLLGWICVETGKPGQWKPLYAATE